MIKICIVSAALIAVAPGMALAAGGRPVGTPAPHYAASLSPAQRGSAISAFVRKWGQYVQQTYGTDVHSWSQRMVPQFAHGDAVNIQRAVARTTFEGAIAELDGVGHRRSDEQVITRLAAQSLRAPGSGGESLLGDAAADLVYTPITPCRIVDTRVAGGAIAANTSRDFFAWGAANYTGQGGSATNCGLQSESPSAIIINVTTVGPVGAGYLTVYPYGATRPTAASVNYANNAIVNNSIVTPVAPGFPNWDFTVYTLRQSHVVVDIVGYFDTPHATALDCTTPSQTFVVNTSAATAATVSCPAGYTVSGGGCYGGFDGTDGTNALVASQPDGSNGWFCGVRAAGPTTDTNNAQVFATCCRVPGR